MCRTLVSLQLAAAVALAALHGSAIGVANAPASISGPRPVRTVTFTVAEPQSDGSLAVAQWMVAGANLVRVERADGTVWIADLHQGKSMTLLPEPRQAVLRMNRRQCEVDLCRRIRDIDPFVVDRLPDRRIAGKPAEGFLVRYSETTYHVWLDAATGERLLAESIATGDDGLHRIEQVESNYRFDVPLDRSLFQLQPPPGYALQVHLMDEPPATL